MAKRWATNYCWDFADGKCKKTAEECGRPHLTNDEAKAKADGKTFADTGFDPSKKKGSTGIAIPSAAPAGVNATAILRGFAALSSSSSSRPE